MPLRHTLLGLLQALPLHGYRLRQQARQFSWIYPMTNTSIYPTLHGLEKAGFVTHHSEIHNGRARKVYEVTEAGRGELSRWLTHPAPQDVTFRDQLLLKISMLDDDAIRGGARVWLEEALEQLRRGLSDSQAAAAAAPEDADTHYSRCAKQYGLDVLKLRVRFLERVLAGQSTAGSGSQGEAEPDAPSLSVAQGR